MTKAQDTLITISLLDPVAGHVVQTWEFDGAATIHIGRADTNDVIVNDTQVSRMHGELTRTEDGWNITPLGRNGIAISGRAITGATPVGHETVLRLATSGPYLEFRVGRRQNTRAQRLADRQLWTAATREREEEQDRTKRTDVTEVDFLKRRPPSKRAD